MLAKLKLLFLLAKEAIKAPWLRSVLSALWTLWRRSKKDGE